MNKQANSGLKIAKVLDVEVFYSTQKKKEENHCSDCKAP